MIRTVFALPKVFDILIIDDGSPDGTALIVKQLQTEFPDKLHLVERTGKLGLGTAYIAGFKWVLERDYQFVFEINTIFRILWINYWICTKLSTKALYGYWFALCW